MDLRKLKTLIDLVEQASISELEITEGDDKVRIVKSKPQDISSQTVVVPANTSSPVAVNQGSSDPSTVLQPLAPSSEKRLNTRIVTSPMVGTFYVAKSPDSAPFVQIGQMVQKGTPLCIIEAMKLMNEIQSEYQGCIKEVLIENGAPVDYGQALFVVEL